MTQESGSGVAARGRKAKALAHQSAITAACEQILQPISAHFLDLGVGIGQFLHVAKITYVHAAAAAIRDAGQRPSVSRVAAVTGLQRKEISHLLSPAADGPDFHVREAPTMRVVTAWRQRKEFRDSSGKPRQLPLEGQGSFKQLVETYAGDVTYVALLRELERQNWARKTEAGFVTLNATRADLKKKYAEAELLALRLSDFASAVVSSGRSTHLQHFAAFRESPAVDKKIGAALTRTFSQRAEEFLDGFERWLSRSVRQSGESPGEATQFGIGIYLIEKGRNVADDVGHSPKRRRATPRAKRA